VEKLSRFHVTTYLNNAMPESEAEMLEVFPQVTMNRLRALKQRIDPDNVFKMGAWQYEANK
jgi:FAD/FMN-containing dehydrogenase